MYLCLYKAPRGFAHTEETLHSPCKEEALHRGGLCTHIYIHFGLFPADIGVLHKAPSQRGFHKAPRGFEQRRDLMKPPGASYTHYCLFFLQIWGCFTKPLCKGLHEAPVRRRLHKPLGALHIQRGHQVVPRGFIQTYAHFSLYSYRYRKMLQKPL